MTEKADEMDTGRVVPSFHHGTVKLEVKDKIGGIGAPRSSVNGKPGVYFLKGCCLCIGVLAVAAALVEAV